LYCGRLYHNNFTFLSQRSSNSAGKEKKKKKKKKEKKEKKGGLNTIYDPILPLFRQGTTLSYGQT
jgi:hypothetical protein